MSGRIQYATLIAGIVVIIALFGLVILRFPNRESIEPAAENRALLVDIQANITQTKNMITDVKEELISKSSQKSIDVIGGKVDELDGQIVKTILVNNETAHIQEWLPQKPGITYRGHVTLNSVDYPVCSLPGSSCFPNPVIILCGLPGDMPGSTSTTAIQPLVGTSVILGQSNWNQDFSCTSLFEDGVSNTTGIYGVIHYVEVKS